MNRCRREKKDSKEYGGTMLNIITQLEGEVPDRSAKGWKSRRGKNKSHKENVHEAEGRTCSRRFHGQKKSWENIVKECWKKGRMKKTVSLVG